MVVFLTIITNGLFAQQRITEKFNNIPLSTALDLITKKYGVKIAFDNSVVEGVVVSTNIKKDLPGQAIEKLLSNTGLEVVKINDVFILKKKALIEPVAEKPKNVVGIVSDKISGETLPYANVKVLGANIGTSTNPDGFFLFKNLRRIQ